MPRKNIFIAAGEPSGDKLGASLIYALKERAPEAYTFWGIGGEAIRAEGLTSLFPLEDIAVMGLTEVIPRLPQIMKHLQTTKRALRAHPPDILLTIDAPEFMYRLHKTSRRLGIPTLHWGAPSVWAWRPGRARKLATRIDHLLALFPFEPPFFEKHGLKTTYVGHPMANDPELQPQVAEKLDDFRAHYRIDAERPLLCVLPGSRKSEIERHFPIFEQTVRLLHTEMPGMQ
ncbi:MAG: hypothetical protein LBH38_01235, partial [Holosporales bacterium]|nr:hypothetical protein [Holosporales bacterium]